MAGARLTCHPRTGGLVVLETHPVQYHAPVFRSVQQRFGIPVTVVYESDKSLNGMFDREFCRNIAWDTDLLSGYQSVFLRQSQTNLKPTSNRATRLAIGDKIRELSPGAILVLGYGGAFDRLALYSACRSGLPLLFRGETTDHAVPRQKAKSIVRDTALRALYHRCARLLYIGRRSLEHYTRLGCPSEKLVFSPYCVDSEAFEPDEQGRIRFRESTRKALNISSADVVLLFSGKLSQRKGPDLLVKAASVLPAPLKDRVVLVFLGDGEMREQLRATAKEAGVRAIFPGFHNQKQLSPFFHAADALILPSIRSETWGLVVNEALHHGLPAVVSDAVGSAIDLIASSQTGLIFESGSSAGLANTIVNIQPIIGLAKTRGDCRRQVSSYSVENAARGLSKAFWDVTTTGYTESRDN